MLDYIVFKIFCCEKNSTKMIVGGGCHKDLPILMGVLHIDFFNVNSIKFDNKGEHIFLNNF